MLFIQGPLNFRTGLKSIPMLISYHKGGKAGWGSCFGVKQYLIYTIANLIGLILIKRTYFQKISFKTEHSDVTTYSS